MGQGSGGALTGEQYGGTSGAKRLIIILPFTPLCRVMEEELPKLDSPPDWCVTRIMVDLTWAHLAVLSSALIVVNKIHYRQRANLIHVGTTGGI